MVSITVHFIQEIPIALGLSPITRCSEKKPAFAKKASLALIMAPKLKVVVIIFVVVTLVVFVVDLEVLVAVDRNRMAFCLRVTLLSEFFRIYLESLFFTE
jgi:hypothetical protein